MMRDKGGVDVRVTIRADGAPDPRRYNAPTAPEIAVIISGVARGPAGARPRLAQPRPRLSHLGRGLPSQYFNPGGPGPY